MSSWVPLRSAPSEPLCLPSTSYAVASVPTWSARLRESRCGAQTHRGRALQRIRCRASQALQSYHNAYKLLHPQNGRTAEPSPAPDASPLPEQQRQHPQQRPPGRSRPKSARPDVLPPPPEGAQPAALHHPSSVAPASTPFNTYPGSRPGSNSGASRNNSLSTTTTFGPELEDDHRPYTPHSVTLPHWQPPPTSVQHRTALTRAITGCTSYTRLHQLILDNAADFNAYHTCASLSRVLALHAAGLTPRESRLFKEGCSTLQIILRRQLPELQPRALVVAAYSLTRLELPDRELLSGLAAAVEPHLSALQPQGLSSLLWAFARQSHQPPPKWMDAVLSACAADLEAFAPRDLATVIWALARLHYKVAPARLQQLLDHALTHMGAFCGRSLSNVVYALALSQQHPGAEWLAAAQARAVALGPDAFSPQGITQMAWGLAKLGVTPTSAFLELVLEHASQRLPLAPQDRLQEREQQQQLQQRDSDGSTSSEAAAAATGPPRVRRKDRYSGLDLATLMYSLASLGAQPRADLGRRLLAAVQWELPSLEANGMCNCLWACARLKLYPTKMWLSAFFDASYRQLPYFKSVDLSQTLWALARLQSRPPLAWLSSALTRLQLSASMFSPVEVATTMWALARLGVRGEQLPAEVLALFFIATDRRLSSFKPQELSSMIWALAHMRRRPDKEWTSEFLKVTYHRLPSMGGWCLATIVWSLAELSLLPPPAWVYNYVNAARALMNATPVQAPTPAQSGSLTTTAAAAAVGGAANSTAGLSVMDLGQIITSLRRLNGSGHGSSGGLAKVEEFLGEAEQRLAAMEAGSAAFARQQLGTFLAMSPEQAGLAASVPAASVPAALVQDPSGDGDGELDLAAGGSAGPASAGPRGLRPSRRRRRPMTALEQASLLRKAEKWGAPPGVSAGRRAATTKLMAAGATVGASGTGPAPAANGINPSSGSAASAAAAAAAAACTAAGAVTAPLAAAASTGASREVTRMLNGGARVTLAPEVHVDLGGNLNVELATSSSGPVLWRSAAAAAASSAVVGGVGGAGNGCGDGAAAGSGNGNGASGGSGDAAVPHSSADDVGSSTAEIKRRLLAV